VLAHPRLARASSQTENAMTRGTAVNTSLVSNWWWAISVAGLGLCLVGAGLLQESLTAMRNNLDTLWLAHLRTVEQALEKGDGKGAMRAWHGAYGAALGSGRWQAMVEVGDAFLRIGEVSRSRDAFTPTARRAYRVALARAVQQRSVDGVLRTAEAFAALGDREIARQCVRIAEQLAAQREDAPARDRGRVFARQLGA